MTHESKLAPVTQCPSCGGSGLEPGLEVETADEAICEQCGGAGEITWPCHSAADQSVVPSPGDLSAQQLAAVLRITGGRPFAFTAAWPQFDVLEFEIDGERNPYRVARHGTVVRLTASATIVA